MTEQEVKALSIPGEITDNYKHVHQRKRDNLPPHIKGEGVIYREFSTSSTAGKVHPRTGYYIEDTDKAVEFLKDKEEDTWYLLTQDNTGRFITCKDNKLNRYSKRTCGSGPLLRMACLSSLKTGWGQTQHKQINNSNRRNRFVEFTHARPRVLRMCMQWPKHNTTQNKNIPMLIAKNKWTKPQIKTNKQQQTTVGWCLGQASGPWILPLTHLLCHP